MLTYIFTGIPDTTYHISTRIVYLVVLMASFFVGVYYNTAILNGLLLPAPNAIQNIEQLLQSDIRLAVLDIPYFHEEMVIYYFDRGRRSS